VCSLTGTPSKHWYAAVATPASSSAQTRGHRWTDAAGNAEIMPIEEQLSDVLSEFARTMLTDFPIQGILDHLVERIVEVLPVTAAGVTLISPGTRPHYVAASDESALRFEKLQTELGEGPCLAAYETGIAAAVADLRHEYSFPRFAPRAVEAGLIAVYAFPLRTSGARLGALDLYRESPGLLDEASMKAAQTLADVAAAYLLNAQARSDLRESSDLSRDNALHDPLTGLPNRTLLIERLEHAVLRARRSGKLAAVLFADLDEFKQVNDLYGHGAGDELLVAVSNRLSRVMRSGDTLARLAGDEFIILCEDIDGPTPAEVIAERIGAALSVPFIVGGQEVTITASVGIAYSGPGDQLVEDLLQEADAAMYQAKRSGGARHQIIDLRERHQAAHRATLQRDLHGAMDRGELRTEYQPLVDTRTRHVIGFEALIRWDHPSRGLVGPNLFIPLAERSGLITAIGEWVLQQACPNRHRWHDPQATRSLTMSVNVSAHQLMAANFAATVAAVLARSDTEPSLVTLEVTESAFVRDSKRALVVLNELKRIGVTLALDDFGTGYSSLTYLKHFPIDIVKIDQGFVADLEHDSASDAIVSSIIELAHKLGMTVVAEGVETAEQDDKLRELESDACQGFYFARPMTPDDLDALMAQHVAGSVLLPVLTAV
jgi:diguanylate cyclase (GGDEF)-like protein